MAFFSCFRGQNFFKIFFENIIASALKSCIINIYIYIFIFFGIKLGFLGLRTFSNVNVQHKGLLLQDWVFRLGYENLKGAIRAIGEEPDFLFKPTPIY